MSRFVEEAAGLAALTPASALAFTETLRGRLGSPASRVLFRFPLFVQRLAPVTGVAAPHRYEAWIDTALSTSDADGARVLVGVRAAVTSLCPCSREISDYGAHSQRGHVEVEVESPGWCAGDGIWPQELFAYADESGSAQIHPLLKRPDERAVTMTAYDHPAFVEDIARQVVLAVKQRRAVHPLERHGRQPGEHPRASGHRTGAWEAMIDANSILILSACTATKAAAASEAAVPAEELYAGQQHRRLMRGVSAYRNAGQPAGPLALHIVSAGHGVVPASERLRSYDATFTGMPRPHLRRRAARLGVPRAVSDLLARRAN